MKESLAVAQSEIYYSFDLWTSSNYKAMLAVIGHWTAADSLLKTVLLGIRKFMAITLDPTSEAVSYLSLMN